MSSGTFEAVRIIYRIEKTRGPEVYQILTNRDGPRMVLKEEFPNGHRIRVGSSYGIAFTYCAASLGTSQRLSATAVISYWLIVKIEKGRR